MVRFKIRISLRSGLGLGSGLWLRIGLGSNGIRVKVQFVSSAQWRGMGGNLSIINTESDNHTMSDNNIRVGQSDVEYKNQTFYMYFMENM